MRSTATKAPVGLWLARGSQRLGMSNVVAAAALRKGVFNLTRTGIAAELTAASEQRLPPVGGRCRIATKRGVQGSEAGAVVSGMRTPLQGVKHTLGTTTRDRAAVRSTATKAPVGLWLARGSQRLGMSNVVAAAALRKGVFNLTRTGIAAELTAASGGDRAAVRLHLEYHMPFMDKKPGRGTRSGALLPGFSAFSVNFRPEIVTKLCQ